MVALQESGHHAVPVPACCRCRGGHHGLAVPPSRPGASRGLRSPDAGPSDQALRSVPPPCGRVGLKRLAAQPRGEHAASEIGNEYVHSERTPSISDHGLGYT